MNENLKELFDRLSADPALREKITEQPSMEEAYAVAAEVVPGFTREEFTSAMVELRRLEEEERTDEELEKVNGGVEPPRAPYFAGRMERL